MKASATVATYKYLLKSLFFHWSFTDTIDVCPPSDCPCFQFEISSRHYINKAIGHGRLHPAPAVSRLGALCQTWCHPQSGSITDCTIVRQGPNCGHRYHVQKILCSLHIFRECKQTDRPTQTSKHTDRNGSHPFRWWHNYSVSQKKGATLYISITLSILDRFAKFFHCCKEQ